MRLRPFSIRRKALEWSVFVLAVALGLGIAAARFSSPPADSISGAEFTRIIQEFSEPGGYFQSDNLISNEEGYLTIIDKMQELGASGGAYIGVGPEQNFTYIARIRPKIAFIIDIRRQAMVQQLMYKALFHMSKNRTEFLARLLSRPLTGEDAPGPDASMREMMGYFGITAADDGAFASNLAEIKRMILRDFKFPLSENDLSALDYIFEAFRTDGVYISFRMGGFRGRGRFGRFPSMRQIFEQPDSKGQPGNFLARDEDYEFVRELQRQNRIIPVVGDLAGKKALKAIAQYLRTHSYQVTVFYNSNVEQYLFQNGVFEDYAENVKALPIRSNSLFIRSVPTMWRSQFRGRTMDVLLQNISTFVEDYDEGLYTDYWTLVNTHFIPLSP